MGAIKVSVLVPVYNAEAFLRECLDSLVGQSLREIEIICINDGSTDGSLEVLKSYAEKDERMVILDKKNTGYGDSMNKGIDKARGKFIGIVEPDDFVELSAFEKMYKKAQENEVEVVKANFYRYMTGKKDVAEKSEVFTSVEIGKVVDPEKDRHLFYTQPSVWSAIYKTEFLKKNGIKFLSSPGASYQDAGFSFKVWATAKRVYCTDEAFLYYRQDNPGSSVKSEGKVYAVQEEYDDVEKYLVEKNRMSEFGATLAVVRMGGYIWNMRRLTKDKALEFAKVVEKDYARYKMAGYFDDGAVDDDPDARFIVQNMIIRDPVGYVKKRKIYEMNDSLKQWGVKKIKKITRRR
ncbi:glycosyltransferase [Candidatus Saccharibacteria bacterium]|nr:glycosyltransferase [Candidatus Saccharibacteria bacterium]